MTPAEKSQQAYIREERRKMRRLRTARLRFESVAAEMNFHPLDRGEIYRRLQQLDAMESHLRSGEWIKLQPAWVSP